MITARYSASMELTEHIHPSVVTEGMLPITHKAAYSRSGIMHDGWSQRIVVPMGGPVVFDVKNLTYANSSTIKDLFSNQEIRLFRVRNIGTGVVNLTLKNDMNDELLVDPLMPGVDQQSMVLSGHLFAQAVKTFELMPLTGESTIDIMIGTQRA